MKLELVLASIIIAVLLIAGGFYALSLKTSEAYQRAPEISTPDGFLNTKGKAVSLEELRGKKVVLLDIWSYSCINCQRAFPYLNEWYKKYKDQGLEIIAVHTPEFAYEQNPENVEEAVRKYEVEFPVVIDNDYSTWKAYDAMHWPRTYLIDLDGYIVYSHTSEGSYEETEKRIQELLEERKRKLENPMQ